MKRLLTLTVIFSLFVSFCSAQKAFMKITASNGAPIRGTSNNSDHLNEIEIESYSNVSGLCLTGSCIDMQDIIVRVPNYEPALVILRNEMFSARIPQEVVLSFQRNGFTRPFDYNVITMRDVAVTSITEAYSDGNMTITQITFKPVRVGWTSIGMSPSGELLSPVKFGWDFKANKAWTTF